MPGLFEPDSDKAHRCIFFSASCNVPLIFSSVSLSKLVLVEEASICVVFQKWIGRTVFSRCPRAHPRSPLLCMVVRPKVWLDPVSSLCQECSIAVLKDTSVVVLLEWCWADQQIWGESANFCPMGLPTTGTYCLASISQEQQVGTFQLCPSLCVY